MPYNDNMNQEQAPKRKTILDQGWRVFNFKQGKEMTSKAGNSMFMMIIKDKLTDYTEDIYLVRTPGKRWTLKCVLDSFDIKRESDGTYIYDLEDLLNKDILGLVVHEPNEYINREGVTVKTTQHKIVDFKKYNDTHKVIDPSQIQWKD